MATVKNTVKRGMLSYSGIFPTVGSVLHHLFFVIGNGFEWHNGELVDRFEKKKRVNVKDLADKERAEYAERIAGYKAKGLETLGLEQELHMYEFVVANIDRIVNDRGIRGATLDRDPYPICKDYAKIFNVPDDVKNDWLWAMYHNVQSVQVALRQRHYLSDIEKEYEKEMPALHDKFEAMLIARGEMATREERNKMAKEIIAKVRAERT